MAENTNAIGHHLNLAAKRAVAHMVEVIEQCPENSLDNYTARLAHEFSDLGADFSDDPETLEFMAGLLLRAAVWIRRGE